MDVLKSCGLDDIHVSGELEGYPSLPDAAPFSGPAAAMAGCLKSLKRYDGILFVPVDMPLLTPEILQRLLQKKEGAYFEDWPLPAFLPTSGNIGAPSSVKDLLVSLDVRPLPVPEGQDHCFINANTQQEWKKVI